MQLLEPLYNSFHFCFSAKFKNVRETSRHRIASPEWLNEYKVRKKLQIDHNHTREKGRDLTHSYEKIPHRKNPKSNVAIQKRHQKLLLYNDKNKTPKIEELYLANHKITYSMNRISKSNMTT